jgi:hypothetical protein
MNDDTVPPFEWVSHIVRYWLECLEDELCELLRVDGFLRSSSSGRSRKFRIVPALYGKVSHSSTPGSRSAATPWSYLPQQETQRDRPSGAFRDGDGVAPAAALWT